MAVATTNEPNTGGLPASPVNPDVNKQPESNQKQAETSKPTTHHEPVYVVDDIVHYCVTNIPGAVGRTSSQALCNATLPYVRQLSNVGLDAFLNQSKGHRNALNIYAGKIKHLGVANAFPRLPNSF